MEHTLIKPEPDLKKLWNLISVIYFILGVLCAAILLILKVHLIIPVLFMLVWMIVIIIVLLYIPAFFMTLEYSIGNDAIYLWKGVFWKRQTTVPYTKITNIDLTQGPLERIYKISKVHIQTAGASGQQNPNAELVMLGIRDAETIKNNIMDSVKNISIHKSDASGKPDQNLPESDLLQAILKELSGIRELLAKK